MKVIDLNKINLKEVKSRISVMSIVIGMMMLIMCGCNSNECFENKNSLPYAGFYSSGAVPTKISISDLTVWGVGVPNDSLLLDGKGSAESVYLPFKIDSDETSFVFSWQPPVEDGVISLPVEDVVTFRYRRQPWFASSACGASYNFIIDEIEWTGTLIDRVECPVGIITNKNSENISIYFNTLEEEVDE